ncbi:50S ribosomal protein L18e [Candidatus Woesearchaeota archaeon]|nr:50S ribosomal protein L18e [Candidatus Woesearchaeota archaeon]
MKPVKKNSSTAALVQGLKRLAIEQDVKLWKRIATDLEKPTRQRRVVNIYKIDQHTNPDEVVIVPGKVLGVGELSHKVTVAALRFSDDAKDKINAQGTAMTIDELMQKNPKGSKVRILG